MVRLNPKLYKEIQHFSRLPGGPGLIVRLVASLIAESRVREFDPGQYYTLLEIDNGILSLFIQEGLLAVTSDSCALCSCKRLGEACRGIS